MASCMGNGLTAPHKHHLDRADDFKVATNALQIPRTSDVCGCPVDHQDHVSSDSSSGDEDSTIEEAFSLHITLFHASNAGTPPCEAVLNQAEARNRNNGHENDGFLSRATGFMPLRQPLTHLPESHKAWDDLAADLPRLLKLHELRITANRMPVLSADADQLPAAYLRRASMVLAIIAHSYIHIDAGGPTELPECIEKPWQQVSDRLGQKAPFLSYIDLIVYNYQSLSGDVAMDALRVKNMRLLVPTVGNVEETTFYLAQTEIVAQTTPLLSHIVSAQRAVLANDATALSQTLTEITSQLNRIARLSLKGISPRSTHPRSVDPVVWAKTVAPLAAPLRSDVHGPGGIASPIFHMMDAFIGRENYKSFLGMEMQKIQKDYPPHWQAFIQAIRKVSVSSFIAQQSTNPALDASWASLREAYCGREGLLGLHRRKAYAYLIVAFKAGRSATTAAITMGSGEDGWLKVQKELEQSRQERYAAGDTIGDPATATTAPAAKRYAVSELARHCSNPEGGYWFAARGRVYDVSKYTQMHPGGEKILANSAGRDVTADLQAVLHFQIPSIRAKLDKFAIGELDICSFSDARLQAAYDFAVAMVYKAVDSQTTYRNDVSFLDLALTSAETCDELTPQKLRLLRAAQEQIHIQHIPVLASHLLAVAGQVLHERASLDKLASLAGTLHEPPSQMLATPRSSWSEVRSMVAKAAGFLDSLRMDAIALLASLEAFGDEKKRKDLIDASEGALVAMMEGIVRASYELR